MKKIETMILARRDDTVRLEIGGQEYVFERDEVGRLVTEVGDEHADVLLASGDFLLLEEHEGVKNPPVIPLAIRFVSPQAKQKFSDETQEIQVETGVEGDGEFDTVRFVVNGVEAVADEENPFSLTIKKVVPGAYEVRAVGIVGDQVVSEAELVFSVNKPKAAKGK